MTDSTLNRPEGQDMPSALSETEAAAALAAVRAELETSRKALEDLREAHEQRCRKLAETQAELYDQKGALERLEAGIEQTQATRFRETTILVKLSEELRSQVQTLEKQLMTADLATQTAEARTTTLLAEHDAAMRDQRQALDLRRQAAENTAQAAETRAALLLAERDREVRAVRRGRERLTKLEAKCRNLGDRLKLAEKRTRTLQESLSWRITAPLRRVRRFFGRK